MKQFDNRFEDIEELFDQADQDGDDFISLTEFRGLMVTLGRHTSEAIVASGFQEIDVNHDGRITFPEFRAWWLRR